MKLLYKINKTDPEGERSEVLYIYYCLVCLSGLHGHVVKEPTQPLFHLFNNQSTTPPPSTTSFEALQRVRHCSKVIYHLTPRKRRSVDSVLLWPSPVGLLQPCGISPGICRDLPCNYRFHVQPVGVPATRYQHIEPRNAINLYCK